MNARFEVRVNNYCPVLKGLPSEDAGEQTVELDNNYIGTSVCGSQPALETYETHNDEMGTIELVDKNYDGYTGTTGPYSLSCRGCSGLPKGFTVNIAEITSHSPKK